MQRKQQERRQRIGRMCLMAIGIIWPAVTYGGEQPAVQPAAQVRHVDEAEVTFETRPTGDGGIEIEGRGGDLVFRKTSFAGGGFTLDLQSPDDRVEIGVTPDGVTIARQERRISVRFDQASETDVEDARVLLAASPAVHLTRLAAAAVEQAGDDSAPATALLIGDALVGLLSGDPGAPGRVARHLSRHGRSVLRRVATTDCFNEWERRVLIASYEWESCAGSFSVWNPVRNLCAFRWLLQVESYWFTFLSCTGFRSF